MPKQKPTSTADITAILKEKFPDEMRPKESTLDTVKRLLLAIVPDETPVGQEAEIRVDGAGTHFEVVMPSVPPDKLLVDKRLFFELFSAMVRGQYIRYNSVAGMSRIAKIMGAKDHTSEKKAYAECETYLKNHKH